MWGFVFRNAFSDRSHEERTVRLQWAEVLATNVAKHAFEKHAFEIIRLLTRDNPAQILVSAINNGAPRGDSTRPVRTHTCWEFGTVVVIQVLKCVVTLPLCLYSLSNGSLLVWRGYLLQFMFWTQAMGG